MKKNKKHHNIANDNCKCTFDEKCSCENECTCDECTCDECTCDNEGDKCACTDECSCEKCACEDDSSCEKSSYKDDDLLKDKIKELEEKLVRSQAELINYKKRKDDETSRMLKYSEEGIISDLLPIIDNFERAIQMDDNNLEDEVSRFLSGFKMIYSQAVGVLEKFEVKEIDCLGKEFDPNNSQAVLTGKDDTKEKGVVLEVLQKGYTYKDKVIRPAMVKVNE